MVEKKERRTGHTAVFRRPLSEQGYEQREKKPEEIVRFFLFQSIDASQLPEHIENGQVDFTRMIFLRTQERGKVDQLIAPGGKRVPHESIVDTGKRTVLEETHVRPTEVSTRALHSVQNYTLQKSQDDTHEKRTAHALIGRLIPQPFDVPYPLNADQGNIIGFMHVTRNQFRTLARTGMVDIDGAQVRLQASMVRNTEFRESHHTVIEQEEVEEADDEIDLNFDLIEAEKKMFVLEHLIRHASFAQVSKGEPETLYPTIRFLQQASKDFYGGNFQDAETVTAARGVIVNAEQFWQRCINDFQFTRADIATALTHSNQEAAAAHTTRRFDARFGVGVPSVSLLFPLLMNGGSVDREHLRVLGKNSQTKKLTHLTALFHAYTVATDATAPLNERDTSNQFLARRLHGVVKDPTQRRTMPTPETPSIHELIQYIYNEGYINKTFEHSYTELSDKINAYFSQLYREAHVDETVPLNQLPAIQEANLGELLSMAFGKMDGIAKDEETKRRLRWEAQRKLVLLMLLNDVWNMQTTMVQRGIAPITAIEENMFIQSAHEPTRLQLDQKDFFLHRHTRPGGHKTLMSLLRKTIVRNILPTEGLVESHDEIKDIFAEAIIFGNDRNEFTDSDMEWVRCRIAGRVTDKKGRTCKEFSAPRVVRELMKRYLQDAHVRLLDYTPLPKAGAPIVSKGPGGGGKVRYTKFYIEHVDPQTQLKRYKEIQIFLPKKNKKGEWVSGEVDYQAKMEDQRTYELQRLFFPIDLRSFMELLYPGEIYGESVRPALFRHTVSKEKIKAKLQQEQETLPTE
ncbi:MAG: hypothetical protein HYV32_06555 [Candidatus Kerfeldbacteria bacterium]|nr:hypothetical protein [Candidatus Kerfeldbacteria bacterium]